MIRSKLGTPFRKLKKAVDRFFCGVLAALVLFASVTAPVRATGTLAAITGASVVAAFLMASGIYPFITEDGQSFGEWGAERLNELADQYAATTPTGDFGLSEFTGFITGKTIAIAKGSWEKLRAFAQWIVSEFSVTDNERGFVLAGEYIYLPNLGDSPSISNIVDNGFRVGVQSSSGIIMKAASNSEKIVAMSYTASSGNTGYVFISTIPTDEVQGNLTAYLNNFSSSFLTYNLNLVYSYKGKGYNYNSGVNRYWIPDKSLPVFPDDIDSVLSGSAGVTVDTTTVSVPAALPETAEYGGLTIPDAVSGTAPAITGVIEQGVTDRTQPAVIPTVVEIPADIEITDDGTITENPVVVTPEMALPSVADLSLPASVIASFKTKFPFCLPWDIMAFFQPLSVTPQAPVIRCAIPDPFTESAYEIVVDLSPWDSVAAIVRHFESVIIAVGFALGFRKFVLIGAHS